MYSIYSYTYRGADQSSGADRIILSIGEDNLHFFLLLTLFNVESTVQGSLKVNTFQTHASFSRSNDVKCPLFANVSLNLTSRN